jgi:hypothetical protein
MVGFSLGGQVVRKRIGPDLAQGPQAAGSAGPPPESVPTSRQAFATAGVGRAVLRSEREAVKAKKSVALRGNLFGLSDHSALSGQVVRSDANG